MHFDGSVGSGMMCRNSQILSRSSKNRFEKIMSVGTQKSVLSGAFLVPGAVRPLCSGAGKYEFTSLFLQTLRVLMKCSSCTAANVATPATMARGTMDQSTAGTERKSKRPVSLLAFVWGKQKRLQTISADI